MSFPVARARFTFFASLLATVLLSAGCANLGRSGEDFRAVIQRAQQQVYPALVFLKPIKQHLTGGERQREQTFGSGVIVSADGLVVTNSHVAKDAAEIKCVLYNREQLPARVVGLDEDTDLALVKLQLPANHPPLKTVRFGDSDRLREGQFVVALGSPLGFSRSITFGMVSCVRRYLEIGQYNLWIQTDAAINPGNSGGPLVDDQGRVIGINTLRVSWGENIGFAIPANVVKRVVDALREHKKVKRSYTGIQFQAIRDFMRDVILDYDRGVVVAGVDERSPAAAAGMKAGDLILDCDGTSADALYLEDLPAIRTRFASLPEGVPVALSVMRDGEKLTLDLTPTVKQVVDTEGVELPDWNCSAQRISQFRTPGLAYFRPEGGVYVLGVRRPGNAYRSGLRSGDVIISINNQSIPDMATLQETYRILSRLERGQRTALLRIMRDGHIRFTVLDFNTDYKALDE